MVALRAGYAIPKGKVTEANQDRLSDWFAGQASFLGELGWHVHPNLFLGGYAGIGIGGAGDVASNFCTAGDATCVAVRVRFGVELQLHILPAGDADPWLGYGIGLEGASLSEKNSRHSQTQTLTGFEFAHFMGGVDVRVGKRFGLGPVVDVAVGRYSHLTTELDGANSVDRSLDNRANHEWHTLGVRGVFYP